MEAKVVKINGPVVVAEGGNFVINEMVRVGNLKLIGEVIGLDDDFATIQVYEETSGMKVGEPVEGTGNLLSVVLGPGMIGSIYDGIQRPLKFVEKLSGGPFIQKGIETFPLNTHKRWKVEFLLEAGDTVNEGQIYAQVKEGAIVHKLMVPCGVNNKKIVERIDKSELTVKDYVYILEDGTKLGMYQTWPVRIPRPVKKRLPESVPLITGQRVIDTFFPIAKGGTAAIPGGFGTGKTMLQHQLAKWADADIIVYIGCGERGNEMTEVLTEFPKLQDPRTGKPLMERTILIANTSNMPVSAREASIYTGITIAEYFRDMGYNVAIMADSTSRWAEALRELSGRLEEIPAEEGYPAYLASRIAQFYERAGYAETLSGKRGSVTVIGAVSPPGGDFSEPVTTHTKRFVRCFWALDRELAYSRHYPAINWNTSYSGFIQDLRAWYGENVDEKFPEYRDKAMSILEEDGKLQSIINIMGEDVLPDSQKLVVRIAKMIKVGILQQNAYSAVDSYCPLKKQFLMLKTVMDFYEKAKEFVEKKVAMSVILKEDIVSKIMRMKEEAKTEEDIMEVYRLVQDHFKSVEEKYRE
ncbi:MAG: V-type ATP synthase subunit A [Thermotogaceae bacterium]|nr:V-type ATP synthase subunit A [Thermotogaceae bacterium]